MSLMRKDKETVRHFALRVQQLVKKGRCNESASTINLENNKFFTKGLPKKLKDFADKRQVKHVSTLLEPSIPFYTLVRHVDSKDIANGKIRTNDLALEINKVSIEDDTNNKDIEHDHIMVTQYGVPDNKSEPAYKKYCSYCHKNNHGISNCYQKQCDDEYQSKIKDPELLNNPLFNTFEANLIIPEKIEMKIKMITLLEITIVLDTTKTTIYTKMTDIEVMTDIEATVEIINKTIIDLILDKDTTIDPKVRTHLDPDMTTITEEELHPDLHIEHHIETILLTVITLDQDIDLVPIHKKNPLDDTIIHIDLHLDQETIDHDLEHPLKTDNKTE